MTTASTMDTAHANANAKVANGNLKSLKATKTKASTTIANTAAKERDSSSSSSYARIRGEFIQCHQSHANVLMHLLTVLGFYTSLLGLIGLAALHLNKPGMAQALLSQGLAYWKINSAVVTPSITTLIPENYFLMASAALSSLGNILLDGWNLLVYLCFASLNFLDSLPLGLPDAVAASSLAQREEASVKLAGMLLVSSLYEVSLFFTASNLAAFFTGAKKARWENGVSTFVQLLTFSSLVLAISLVLQYPMTPLQTLGLFIVSYLGQDVAHFVTSEETYQNRYMPGAKGGLAVDTWGVFAWQLTLHSYYMMPLVFEAALSIGLASEVLSWFLVLDRMVKVKLDSPEALANLKIIRDWLDHQNLRKEVTTHEWYASLPAEIKKAFDETANAPVIMEGFRIFFPAPAYNTVVLESMNEIYVATTDTSSSTSDNVFYSNHVDGPFMCYPFASVYRAILAVNSNDFIKTIFPSHPCEKLISDGELWAFDFNREVHRIEQVKQPQPGQRRYTLKLHYLVYLSAVPAYGWILGHFTSIYDTIARLAFLKTLVPKTRIERGLWGFIMLCTRVFYGSIRAAGNSGAISFLALTAIVSHFTKSDLPLFLISSSFIHYFIYISTYYHYETHKDQIVFEGFKSTVIFYKAVAFYHLISTYVGNMNGKLDLISLAMIAIGFTLSGTAAAAIGISPTYFGVELGRCKPGMRVTGFPYNITAHPMILGNILGLLGFMKMDGFREAMPLLVPTHILLYTIHMIQEHFDIHKHLDNTSAFSKVPVIFRGEEALEMEDMEPALIVDSNREE